MQYKMSVLLCMILLYHAFSSSSAFKIHGTKTMIQQSISTVTVNPTRTTSPTHPPEKRMKAATAIIATHSGSFHADEALACAMLRLLPAYTQAKIIRTRAPEVMATADIVVDVGGVYDPATHRYDHHQRSFTETFGPANTTTRLSSAGLVYRHFGLDILQEILSWEASHPSLSKVYQKIYDSVIEAYDAVDNGLSRYPSDVAPKYKESSTIYDQVSRLNPWWNEKDADVEERFAQAMTLTGSDFVRRVRYVGLSWLPARDIVIRCLKSRFDVHPSGHIMVLDQFCPWKDHLHELEGELGIEEGAKPLYALYEDDTAKQWRVQAVAITPNSFESRKPLPEPWRGIRDSELSTLTGIPGGVFVHATGFIGGNATYDGALEMAKRALAFSA